MKKLFFNKSKELEEEIDEYLDTVNKAILIFQRDANKYIKKEFKQFEESRNEINDIENKADEYQKDIKIKLYKYMLIPEARGDVLKLLESIDNIVDLIKEVLIQFSIENPYIPDYLEDDFKELVDKSVETVEELTKGTRAYFEEITIVNDYINKVHFYEHEADIIEEKIQRKVFADEEIDEFSKKVHIRYFSEKIALISDEAETISEHISVAAIKRSL